MRRFTTPIYTFTFPVDVQDYARIVLTFVQAGKVILKKTEKDFVLSGNTAKIMLTQEETGKFEVTNTSNTVALENTLAKFQIKVLTKDGKVYGTSPWKEAVREMYDEEILVDQSGG